MICGQENTEIPTTTCFWMYIPLRKFSLKKVTKIAKSCLIKVIGIFGENEAGKSARDKSGPERGDLAHWYVRRFVRSRPGFDYRQHLIFEFRVQNM